MEIKKNIKKLFNHLGYDLARKKNPLDMWDPKYCKYQLLKIYDINLVFDVGANIGQYAKELRENSYEGKIISFEPQTLAYQQLSEIAKTDPLWKTCNFAIGNDNRKDKIYISSERSTRDTSSILKALPTLTELISNANQTESQEVAVYKIDSIIDEYYDKEDRLFLKVDTQGYEKQVIDGALNSLEKIFGIQLELSLIPLYTGETLFIDMVQFLSQKAYILMSLDVANWNSYTGQLIQVDATFFSTRIQPKNLPKPKNIRKLGYPKVYF